MRTLQIGDTLQLQIPFGKTWLLALLLVGAVAVGAELAARSLAERNDAIVPSVGSLHRQFEISLARLEEFSRHGRVDCVILGSSVVYRGLDPDALSRAYAAETGKPLRCFNMGIQALTASTVGKLARILVEDYQPGLIVYGTTAHDYSPKAGRGALDALEGNPWFAYRSGQFNPVGWLVEHSFALRYYLVHRDWMKHTYAKYLRDTAADEAEILPNGYNPRVGSRLYPKLELRRHQLRGLARLYADYALAPNHVAGLEQFLELDGRNTQALVIELPIHQRTFEFFPRGRRDYDAFVATVQAAAETRGVPFWRAPHADLLPDVYWYDIGHLNEEGASLYSDWLGHALGKAVVEKSLRDPGQTPPRP